jgi:hypothetical protein
VQPHDVVTSIAARAQPLNVRRPCVERRALFLRPIVALIDANYARAAARNVIEQGFRDFELNAQPLQAGREAAAKIVRRHAAAEDALARVGRLRASHALRRSPLAEATRLGAEQRLRR